MFKVSGSNKKISNESLKKEARLKLAMDLIEFLTILISIPIAYFITSRFLAYFNYVWQFNLQQFAFFSVLIIISWIVLYQVMSMAKLPRTQRYLTLFFHFVRVNFLNLLVLLLLKFIFNLQSIPHIFIFFLVPISMIITFTMRMIAFSKLKIYRTNGHNLRHVMIIADSCSAGIIEKFNNQKEWGFKIDSIITQSGKITKKYAREFNIYPDTLNIKNILDNHVVDEVIYSKSQIDEEEINRIVNICDEVGVIFRLQSCASPIDQVTLQMKTIDDRKQLALVDIPSNNMPLIIKTMADIYFAITAVILLMPLFLFIAALIKLESRGPVFFKQERIGLRGRKFILFKFRTMAENAEELLEKLKGKNEMDGPTFKMKDDPRITRIGRFLRKTGLDEFPQLFNVISGEMSLIGPRPPLESEVKQYKRWQLRRLSVKPGITCTWQISPNRNDVKFEKWMQLDLNYIDNWSLIEDLKLFFKTISSMFLASGR
jgi:exopolysaccharide biosynthesis polyprenyl glycosylphosphotransferase